VATSAQPPDPHADLARRTLDPLWRGLAGYRLLAWCYAAGLVAVSYSHYRSPGGAVAVLAVMAGWTALTTLGYLRPWRVLGRRRLAAADVVVTSAAVLCTRLVDTPDQIDRGASPRDHHVLPAIFVSVHGAKIAFDAAKSHSTSSSRYAGTLSRWSRRPRFTHSLNRRPVLERPGRRP